MRLQAQISKSTGNTQHSLGTIIDGEVTPLKQFSRPSYLEISDEDGGFYLLYFDHKGQCITDTWHQTLKDAKRQAEFEFEIEPEGWKDISI